MGRWLLRRLRGGRLEPWRAGLSIAVGLFIGVQPLYGLHFFLCLAVCLPLRLDALVAYAAANISNPLLAPLIVASEIQVGSLVMDGKLLPIHISRVNALNVGHLAIQLGVGAVLLGLALALAGGSLAGMVVSWANRSRKPLDEVRRRQFEDAVHRTTKRYSAAPRADRHYVAMKLKFDPIGRAIDEATGELGEVFDLGCGRGQLGLLLFELGKVQNLAGFDWDERKVAVARAAATGVGRYDKEDMQRANIPESDTVLMADVLHYLDEREQDALLARAAAALREGGRLIVRDVDARRTIASRFTQWCERVGVRLGVNRARVLTFRSREQHREALERVGLVVTDGAMTPGLRLDNALLIATRPKTLSST